jgi:hypothetical protein
MNHFLQNSKDLYHMASLDKQMSENMLGSVLVQ